MGKFLRRSRKDSQSSENSLSLSVAIIVATLLFICLFVCLFACFPATVRARLGSAQLGLVVAKRYKSQSYKKNIEKLA